MRALLLTALLTLAPPAARADTGAALASYDWGGGAVGGTYDLNVWFWVMDDQNQYGYYQITYSIYAVLPDGTLDPTDVVHYTSPWESEPSDTYSWYVGPLVPPPLPHAGYWGAVAMIRWTNGVPWADKIQSINGVTDYYELAVDVD